MWPHERSNVLSGWSLRSLSDPFINARRHKEVIFFPRWSYASRVRSRVRLVQIKNLSLRRRFIVFASKVESVGYRLAIYFISFESTSTSSQLWLTRAHKIWTCVAKSENTVFEVLKALWIYCAWRMSDWSLEWRDGEKGLKDTPNTTKIVPFIATNQTVPPFILPHFLIQLGQNSLIKVAVK